VSDDISLNRVTCSMNPSVLYYDDEARAVQLGADLAVLSGGSRVESGTRRFVLARFLDGPTAVPFRTAASADGEATPPLRSATDTASSASSLLPSRYVITTAPYEITRTGAIAGG